MNRTEPTLVPRKSGWLRFSIRSLILLTLIASVCLGWLAQKASTARFEEQLANKLREMVPEDNDIFLREYTSQGISCFYDFQLEQGQTNGAIPAGPKWLRNIFHDKMFSRIGGVNIGGGTEMVDLKLIGQFTELKWISITGNNNIHSLNGIENLPDLEELSFRTGVSQKLENREAIVGLKNLRTVELQLSNNSELALFRGMKKLQLLDLDDSIGLTNLEDMPLLDSLKTLSLCNTNVESLQGIQRLPNLQRLILGECERLSNIESLKHCKNLKSLVLFGYEHIDDFESLKSLNRLEEFVGRLDNEQILLLPKSLKRLTIYTPNSIRAEALLKFQELDELSLDLFWDSELTDIEPLAGLKNLKRLNLSHSRLIDYEQTQYLENQIEGLSVYRN